jgi:hypothetical protein
MQCDVSKEVNCVRVTSCMKNYWSCLIHFWYWTVVKGSQFLFGFKLSLKFTVSCYEECLIQNVKHVRSVKYANKLRHFTFVWPCCIVTNFFLIKPTRCTNFTNLYWHEILHVSDSSSVHHQEFIHCTLSNGVCHTIL